MPVAKRENAASSLVLPRVALFRKYNPRGVGQNGDVLGVSGVVDTHHEHRSIRRRRRDNDLLGAALQVRARLVDDSEDASRLANDVSARLTPRDLLGVPHREELDVLAVNNEAGRGLVVRDGALVDAVGRVVLEEVRSVFDIAEGVVDRNNISTVLLARSAADKAANAAEAGDTHFDHDERK